MHFARSRQFGLALALLAAVMTVWCLWRKSIHPEFGRISRVWMVEHPNGWDVVKLSFARTMGARPAGDPAWLLRIGPHPFQWSTGGGPKAGYIYMNHPLLDDTPYWEFALSKRRELQAIRSSDLPSEFYGMNDTRGARVFGAAWNGHAIRVPDGQIFFARLTTNRATVYVVPLSSG